jgi:hypothetical protein
MPVLPHMAAPARRTFATSQANIGVAGPRWVYCSTPAIPADVTGWGMAGQLRLDLIEGLSEE